MSGKHWQNMYGYIKIQKHIWEDITPRSQPLSRNMLLWHPYLREVATSSKGITMFELIIPSVMWFLWFRRSKSFWRRVEKFIHSPVYKEVIERKACLIIMDFISQLCGHYHNYFIALLCTCYLIHCVFFFCLFSFLIVAPHFFILWGYYGQLYLMECKQLLLILPISTVSRFI